MRLKRRPYGARAVCNASDKAAPSEFSDSSNLRPTRVRGPDFGAISWLSEIAALLVSG